VSDEYRAIKTELLAEALAIISPRVDSWKRAASLVAGSFAGEATHDISVAFVSAVVENIMDAEPGCDHSVGICMCGERAVVEELRLWLDGKETCPTCHGDGFVWNEAKYKARPVLEDDGDWWGHEACPRCGGKQVVAL